MSLLSLCPRPRLLQNTHPPTPPLPFGTFSWLCASILCVLQNPALPASWEASNPASSLSFVHILGTLPVLLKQALMTSCESCEPVWLLAPLDYKLCGKTFLLCPTLTGHHRLWFWEGLPSLRPHPHLAGEIPSTAAQSSNPTDFCHRPTCEPLMAGTLSYSSLYPTTHTVSGPSNMLSKGLVHA